MPTINKITETDFLTKIQKHKGIIIRLTRVYCDNSEDIKDLQQEILYQLWKSLPSFKGDSKFSTWMYRIAVNTCLLNIKKNKRYSIIDFPDKFPDIADDTNLNSIEQNEKNNLFYSAIHQLNPTEKAIVFYHLEEQSHREIANNLGISEVNARVKLNRIKEKIKEIIKKQGYEF